ncbi:hypothetical protein BC831DRAFT_474999 [Entophlyctis helioformis]|nr:hypothetical protein BC831DRAFT_474999 [Entophlyctis helioformis]
MTATPSAAPTPTAARLWAEWDAIASNASMPQALRLRLLHSLATATLRRTPSGPYAPSALPALPTLPTLATTIAAAAAASTAADGQPADDLAHGRHKRRRLVQAPDSAPSGSTVLATTTTTEAVLPYLPPDVLLLIFAFLDAPSLLKATRACSAWRSLIVRFERTFWRNLCARTWNVTSNAEFLSSWQDVYMTHYNIHRNRYLFASFKDPFQQHQEPAQAPLHPKRRNLFAWPADPIYSYIVAIEGDRICWVDFSTEPHTDIKVAIIGHGSPLPAHSGPGSAVPRASPTPTAAHSAASAGSAASSSNTEFPAQPPYSAADLEADILGMIAEVAESNAAAPPPAGQQQPVLVPAQHTLKAHTNSVGLILANGLGQLVSFDDSCIIITWCLRAFKPLRKINATKELETIFSINVHRHRIVGGGRNGNIVVWNGETGDIEAIFKVPEQYIVTLTPSSLLNVALHNDLVVFGLYDGSFFLCSVASQSIVHCFQTSEIAPRPLSYGRGLVRDLASIVMAPPSTADSGLSTTSSSSPNAALPSTSRPVSSMSTYSANGHPAADTLHQLQESEPGPSNPAEAAATGTATIPPAEESQPPSPPAPHALPVLELAGDADADPFAMLPPLPTNGFMPMTLALNGHILITNGPSHDQIAVWDVRERRLISILSESTALERDGYTVPEYRSVKFAEITPDSSCIVSSVIFENNLALLVWDYQALRHKDQVQSLDRTRRRRRFWKVVLDAGLDAAPSMEVWVCTDESGE